MNVGEIVYETHTGYVTRVAKGWYTVYINSGVVAERKATFHFTDRPDYALTRAKQRLDELSKPNCKARQYSDQMLCECGLAWDVNDSEPPECKGVVK